MAVSEMEVVLQGTFSKIRSCSSIFPAASKPVAPPGERQQDTFVLSTESQQERIRLSALLAREAEQDWKSVIPGESLGTEMSSPPAAWNKSSAAEQFLWLLHTGNGHSHFC